MICSAEVAIGWRVLRGIGIGQSEADWDALACHEVGAESGWCR